MRANTMRRIVAPDAEIHAVNRHFERQIRRLRIQSNSSQGDLGKGIGLSYQQMQKHETGKIRRVNASMLHEAAAEINERLTYMSTTDARQLIENMLK